MPDPSLLAKSPVRYREPSPIVEKGMGILLFIAFLFAIVVAAIFGGAVFYKNRLNAVLEGYGRDLARLETELDSEVINEMVRVDNGLKIAHSLLQGHVYSSRVFTFLEDETLKNVKYDSFSYSFGSDKSITLNAKANGYVSMNEQIKRLRGNPAVAGLTLSNIGIQEDGSVTFDLLAILQENLLRYSP